LFPPGSFWSVPFYGILYFRRLAPSSPAHSPMPPYSPRDLRDFAASLVRRLRQAGHEALFAGGCVRDQLLGREPKDYDVATTATPDEVRAIFGDRRTLAIGAAFGVMAVLGPKRMRVEIATFRKDGRYTDGRHPEGVTFSNAEQDAQRRDFTINGLFFDPIEERVIDYVGGEEDLKRRVVRASPTRCAKCYCTRVGRGPWSCCGKRGCWKWCCRSRKPSTWRTRKRTPGRMRRRGIER
jgi:hypothetical protein